MRNYRKNIFRNPKTTQERRESQDKNSSLFRAKRNFKNIPDAYDDILVSRKGKCWKEKRKTQYKDKTGFSWFKTPCSWGSSSYNKASRIADLCCRLDYYYDYQIIDNELHLIWFGKDVS